MKSAQVKLPNIKYDTRPALNCWAPGNYINECSSCKELFCGDKRAIFCADCAYNIKGKDAENKKI